MDSTIGMKRKRFWEKNGYLVFPGFFTDGEVSAVRDIYDRTWDELPPDVVVDDLDTWRRCHITDIGAAERRHRFKVNDLYLRESSLRDIVLSERVALILEDLLGDEPVICNTLNFERGSQQADHLDTLYMTPATEGALVATWMALEDVPAEGGPLRYFPESNNIAPFYFSSGSMHTVPEEMARWSDYMAAQVERYGLGEQRFLARKGDLFVWHALLLHGGSEIVDLNLTRQSLVTHYWTQTDCESRNLDLRPARGGWWFKRAPQPVPTSVTEQSTRAPDDQESKVVSLPDGELRERMESLQGAVD